MIITVSRRHIPLRCLLGIACLLLVCERAWGEDEAPPEAPPAAKAKPAKKAAAPAAEAMPAALEDPGVLAILESRPTTPAELLRAADVLSQLGRPKLAKQFLTRLLDAKLTEAQLAELASSFGTGTFLKISRSAELAPEGAEFANAVLTAATKLRTDPKRLSTIVGQLSSPDQITRQEAAVELYRAHGAAVTPLVRVLADPARAGEHAVVRAMLTRLGSDAFQPLLAVLDGADQPLKLQAAKMLGGMESPEAVEPLLAPALASESSPALREAATLALGRIMGDKPTLKDGQTLLRRSTQLHLEQALLRSGDRDSTAEIWHWDAKARQSTAVAVHPSEAEAELAARRARDLYLLDQGPAAERLYLLSQLEAERYRVGLEKPLSPGAGSAYTIAAGRSAESLEALLAEAMRSGHVAAATAAVQVLGDVGKAELLHQSGRAVSPLAQAARHPDRRLRFAAVDAILKLKPSERFAGSSAVPEELGYMAGSAGLRSAIVAHPKTEAGRFIAGLLIQLGYDVQLATNGRQAYELAIANPDCELALLHFTLDRIRIDELLTQLRRDRRTALLPLGIIAIPDEMMRAERLATSAGRAIAMPGPVDEKTAKFQIGRLNAINGRSLLSVDERLQQAGSAVAWLMTISEQPHGIYDVRQQTIKLEQALDVPELSVRAALALGNIGTVEAQRALVGLANRGVRPLPVREAAAIGFRTSVEKHGILLTSREILEQYDYYNASERQAPAVQKLLASLLDTLEKRDPVEETPDSQESKNP